MAKKKAKKANTKATAKAVPKKAARTAKAKSVKKAKKAKAPISKSSSSAAQSPSVQWERTQLRGPLTAGRLSKFEKSVGIDKLPADYRAFMLEHNGGIAVRRALEMSDFHPDSSPGFMTECECFYPLHDQPTVESPTDYLETSLDKVTANWREETPDSTNHIVIGRDPGGSLFCLAIAGPEPGAISYACHETERLYRVADSFSALCAIMLPVEDDEEDEDEGD